MGMYFNRFEKVLWQSLLGGGRFFFGWVLKYLKFVDCSLDE